MGRHLLRSAVLAGALAAGLAAPAAAQSFRVDVPGLDIRIGHRAPPPLRYERRPHRPGRDFLWIPGEWVWRGDDWAWSGGHWERPAHRDLRWIGPHYDRDADAWRYEPGHWSNQRLVEGDDYRRWREQHDQGRHRGWDRDRDHHRDRDRDRDRDHDHDHR